MVAETTANPPAVSKRKKPSAYRPRIPLPVKLKIRSLYIVQQLSPAEIGVQVGFTRQQVQGLIARQNWCAVKNHAKRSLEQRGDARLREEVEEVHESFAIQTEELTMGVLAKASKAMARQDEDACRDLQALSQTAKNFVGIARQVRGMDISKDAGFAGPTQTLIFVGALPQATPKQVKPAELPAIDLPAIAPAPSVGA